MRHRHSGDVTIAFSTPTAVIAPKRENLNLTESADCLALGSSQELIAIVGVREPPSSIALARFLTTPLTPPMTFGSHGSTNTYDPIRPVAALPRCVLGRLTSEGFGASPKAA